MIMIIRMMSGMSATVMSYKFSSLTLTAQVVHKTVLFPSGGRQCQVPWGSRAVHPRNLPGGPGQDEDPDHAAPLHRQDDLQRLHLLQQLRPHLLPPGQDHQPDHHQLQEVSSHYCRGGKLIWCQVHHRWGPGHHMEPRKVKEQNKLLNEWRLCGSKPVPALMVMAYSVTDIKANYQSKTQQFAKLK